MINRIRFRLRTVLLALAVVAVILMPYGWTARERSAVQAIRAAGGHVMFQHSLSDVPSEKYFLGHPGDFPHRALASIYGNEFVDEPIKIIFISPEIDDRLVERVIGSLQRLPTIQDLQFGDDTKVTDKSVELLARLPQLRTVFVESQTSTYLIWHRDEHAIVRKTATTNSDPPHSAATTGPNGQLVDLPKQPLRRTPAGGR